MIRLSNRHVTVAVILLVAVVALGVVGTSLITAKGPFVAANGNGEQDGMASVRDLIAARGVVGDWARTKDRREWFINGEWSLDCHDNCIDAEPGDIDFNMAYAMYRSGTDDLKGKLQGEVGDQSHGHPFWDFSASSVNVSEDDSASTLTIVGTITGSGGIGTDGITIRLVKKTNGHFTFFFRLDEGNVFATETGGVVVDSKWLEGRNRDHRDDDD